VEHVLPLSRIYFKKATQGNFHFHKMPLFSKLVCHPHLFTCSISLMGSRK